MMTVDARVNTVHGNLGFDSFTMPHNGHDQPQFSVARLLRKQKA